MVLEEFKTRVLPVKNKLYRFALRFLNNEDEAQDVVQEVFIKAWDRREELHLYRSV
ncbi:MAG: sigma factor, partial [Bacteroidota bacterium]